MTTWQYAVLVILLLALHGWMVWQILDGPPVVEREVRVPGPPVVREAPISGTRATPAAVTIRLVSGSGRELGQTTIPATQRRPTLVRDRSVYVASHQDGPTWVYRRVGVER